MKSNKIILLTLLAVVLSVAAIILAVTDDNNEPSPFEGPSLAETEYGCEPGEIAHISADDVECVTREELEGK